MTNLAKFFRFCGFGVATTSLILGVAGVTALFHFGVLLPIVLGVSASCVLLIFAVSWIVLSYGLQRDAIKADREHQRLLAELEEFQARSRAWAIEHSRENMAGA